MEEYKVFEIPGLFDISIASSISWLPDYLTSSCLNIYPTASSSTTTQFPT